MGSLAFGRTDAILYNELVVVALKIATSLRNHINLSSGWAGPFQVDQLQLGSGENCTARGWMGGWVVQPEKHGTKCPGVKLTYKIISLT